VTKGVVAGARSSIAGCFRLLHATGRQFLHEFLHKVRKPTQEKLFIIVISNSCPSCSRWPVFPHRPGRDRVWVSTIHPQRRQPTRSKCRVMADDGNLRDRWAERSDGGAAEAI